MGKIKKRIYPRDVTINIGEGVPIPEHPYPGEAPAVVAHPAGGSCACCDRSGASVLPGPPVPCPVHVWAAWAASSQTSLPGPLPTHGPEHAPHPNLTPNTHLPTAAMPRRPELEGGAARQDGDLAGLLAGPGQHQGVQVRAALGDMLQGLPRICPGHARWRSAASGACHLAGCPAVVHTSSPHPTPLYPQPRRYVFLAANSTWKTDSDKEK